VTWTCHICGRERPDDRISVATHDISGPRFEAKANVRYCNDSAECSAKAHGDPPEWARRKVATR
jgi:hypothetical protein